MAQLSLVITMCVMTSVLAQEGNTTGREARLDHSCNGPLPLYLRKPHQLLIDIPPDKNTKLVLASLLGGEKERRLRHWQERERTRLSDPDPAANDLDPESPRAVAELVVPPAEDEEGPGPHAHLIEKITEADIEKAIGQGLQEFMDYEELQKKLFDHRMFAENNSASQMHQIFRHSPLETDTLSRLGFLMDFSTKALINNLALPIAAAPELATLGEPEVCKKKIQRPEPTYCDPNSRYRAHDGVCNNLENPLWGASFVPLRREVEPEYADGVSAPRVAADGGPLPSARLVSNVINPQSRTEFSCSTVLFMSFGQFIAHDIAGTPVTRGLNDTTISCCRPEVSGHPHLLHPQCLPIDIPVDDPFYAAFGETCMEFVRSLPAGKCAFGPRDQMNEVTAFLDCSQVYGSTKKKADELRTFSDGHLVTQTAKDGQELLAALTDPNDRCNKQENLDRREFCFDAGDGRVNQQILIALITTVWLREHNRLARGLKQLNPYWDDERLYQEARRIAVAKMQHITYNEYLLPLLGPTLMKTLELLPQTDGQHTTDYDPTVDSGIYNEFTTATFRFGHTTVPSGVFLSNEARRTTVEEFSSFFMNPFSLYMTGEGEKVLLGEVLQSAPAVDTTFSLEVSGKLFRMDKQFGLDLPAISIQRGREHGLANYISTREACDLSPVHDFDDLTADIEPEIVEKFRQIYRSVEDIDVFAGGIAERPLAGGMVGPTFACFIVDQFDSLKKGDRYWYEYQDGPGAFTTDQLKEIHQVSLARMLCDNLPEISSIQRWPLELTSAFNPVLQCSSSCIPEFSLYHWRE